jgi:hypothetical protein
MDVVLGNTDYFIENDKIINYLKFIVENANPNLDNKINNIHPKTTEQLSLINVNSIQNKLWKCLFFNDGSITKLLQNLFEENDWGGLKMKFISSKSFEYDDIIKNNQTFYYLNLLSKENKITAETIIERKIIFENSRNLLMEGVSYWDSNFYSKLYSDINDEKLPIGLICIKKQVEFFKTITNYIVKNFENDMIYIFRISSYKNENKVVFILLEIFYVLHFEGIFGKLS